MQFKSGIYRRNLPGVARVFGDRSIAGKVTHLRDVENDGFDPTLRIAVCSRNLILRGDVGLKVSQVKVRVPGIHQPVEDPSVKPRAAGTENIRIERIHDTPDVLA